MDRQLEKLRDALAGRYEVLEEIGSGGMATVYLAHDPKHDRKVALKVLKPELVQTLGAERFLREIKTAAKLTHPHILPLHTSDEADGILFYVMPFVRGESLRTRLTREKRLPVEEAVQITREIADALAYAHSEGVIHRDVKPANIMMEGGHAFLADFGVAHAVAEAQDQRITTTGLAVGTLAYMSPEQATGEADVDGRADQYALGCVLYEMLTGEPPFPAESAAVVLASHLHRRAPPVRAVRPEVPVPLARTVERALAKSPGDRFLSTEAMLGSLESAQAGLGQARLGLRHRWQWLSRDTRRVILSGLSMAVVAMALWGTWLLVSPDSDRPNPSSLVVVPFRGSLTSPQKEELLVTLSDELTRQLNQWDSVTAVPQIALTGIWFDRGFPGPTLDKIDDGLGIARELGVGTLVALSADLRGDSVRLSADLFDSRTGRNRGSTLEAWESAREVGPAAAEIAYLILGIEGTPSEIAQLSEQTNVPGALIEYNSGRKALEEWKLVAAEERFRAATELDPGFAMAQHRLALSRFLEWEEGMADAGTVGEEISRASRAALVNSGGLPLRDSVHIDAFHSFQAGDYERARSLFRTLVERDSTDVYAWLLQGSVEDHDPWLTQSPNGDFRPRRNLNVAMRSHQKAAQLAPGFQGAYATVLEIATVVAETSELGSAPGFEIPRDEFLPPWEESRSPEMIRAFWPVYLDSIVWLDSSEWDRIPDSVVSAGANRLLEESLVGLRRWAAYQSDEARPQQELARLALFLRSRLQSLQDWALVDSLTREALDHASKALSLSPDTTRFQLLRLANLRLASGDLLGARVAWESALESENVETPEPMPLLALNVPMFSGRPAEALRLLPPDAPPDRYYPDSATGGFIDNGGVIPQIQSLEILGSTHVGGSPLEAAFEDLMSRLRTSGSRSDHEVALLRTVTAPRIAVALSLAPTVLEAWMSELELRDPLWNGLGRGREDGAVLLRDALNTERVEIGGATRTYLLGRVAQDVGEDALALRFFSRLDSLAFEIDDLDPGWGLLALSYFYRAGAYDALGETEMATLYYRRFAEAWDTPDMHQTLGQEAIRRLSELSR